MTGYAGFPLPGRLGSKYPETNAKAAAGKAAPEESLGMALVALAAGLAVAAAKIAAGLTGSPRRPLLFEGISMVRSVIRPRGEA